MKNHGRVRWSGGCPGGHYRAQSNALAVTDVVGTATKEIVVGSPADAMWLSLTDIARAPQLFNQTVL